MQINKIVSYIGFAIKSRQAIMGIDGIKSYPKGIYLILHDSSVGTSAQREINFLKDRKNVAVINLEDMLVSTLVHREKCKVIAITNKQLSEAIMKEYVVTAEV